MLAQLASSPILPLPSDAPPPADVIVPCHASFPWSQNELVASASSSGKASPHRLPSRTTSEALNLHHCHWPPSLYSSTPTLHCYKKVNSTLATLPTTQLCLPFASFLAKAPHHRSSTRHYRSLSPQSHAHHPSAQ
jgi:hypothetical protein